MITGWLEPIPAAIVYILDRSPAIQAHTDGQLRNANLSEMETRAL